jgi:hypothetical protein
MNTKLKYIYKCLYVIAFIVWVLTQLFGSLYGTNVKPDQQSPCVVKQTTHNAGRGIPQAHPRNRRRSTRWRLECKCGERK